MDNSVTPVALLLTAVASLTSFSIALVLYIKEVYRKHEARIDAIHQDHKKDLVETIKDSQDLKTKINESISSLEGSNERLIDVIERNTTTVNDLHKYIISSNKS